MNENTSKTEAAFDPMREAGYAGIKIRDRADGGREFIFPVRRNFSEKISFSVMWLVITGITAAFVFFSGKFVNEFPLPDLVRFFILNHLWYIVGLFGLVDLLLTIACLDMWLRSSRVIATAGRLQSVTHWLFFKRSVNIPAASIIEMRIDAATTVNNTVYYDIVVLTVGEKPGWLAKNFPARPHPDSSFTENDLKSFNTGGKKIHIATGIEGKEVVSWMTGEIRRLLKLDNGVPPINIRP